MNCKQSIFIFLIIFLIISSIVEAQIPQVPAVIQFADLTLQISPQAMREIQLDVDAQYRNPTYFKIKQERVNLYMPIIERVLLENDVPLDFKYLVIQESALISDAVSTSNAVGFWQFKKSTAEEVFLRVDQEIDERKNIVSATRGAALYLKKHNNTFDNWMAALVSYQMGLGGAKAYFGTSQNGKKIIRVEKDTYWYFKKFLAHKIAFEGQTAFLTQNKRLVEIQVKGPTNLFKIAEKYGISESHIFELNKWTKNGEIPADKTYSVVFEQAGIFGKILDGSSQIHSEKSKEQDLNPSKKENILYQSALSEGNSFPKISGSLSRSKTKKNHRIVNGLKGVWANQTSSVSTFAKDLRIKESRFRKWNEFGENEKVKSGNYYYLERKNVSAEVSQHIVLSGETLWSISQKYGILLSSLKSKNRIKKDSDLQEGMILNLQEPKKRATGIKIKLPQLRATRKYPPRELKTQANPKLDSRSSTTSQEINPKAKNIDHSKSSKTIHTVLQGETLFAISRKYNVTVEQLKKWNGIDEKNIINIGKKLIIFLPKWSKKHFHENF